MQRDNACALPGVDIKYDNFMTCMRRAEQRGYVSSADAEFVAEGLRYGFTCGIDTGQLRGHRFHKNYKSAIENRTAVTTAVMKRVKAGKTLVLGEWCERARAQLRGAYDHCVKFPLGAVPKDQALEPGAYRPCSDHTKTKLNDATCMDRLRHTLTAYRDIAEYLKKGYFMRVTDVDNAFAMLPLHPDVWPFFMFSFWADDDATAETLFMHITGDFGTRGMPGTFKIFFVDVVIQMARSELVLTLPLVVYVDDCGLCGPEREATDAEMLAFHAWAEEVCGVHFKAAKDKPAAQEQLMIGFWWNSVTRTRTLEARKLAAYIDELVDFAGRRSLSLSEMQSIAGKVQRAIQTMPPGAACLCANMYALTQGLKLPWQRRRTNAAVRQDFRDIAELLQLNLGRGYFSYDQFDMAPAVFSDASKSHGYCGGGFVSETGHYSFWSYGTSASRKPIDFLEGDTAVHTCEVLGHMWRNCTVPFGVDNMAFKASAVKGWSHAERLQGLMRQLFALQISGDYILQFFWLASKENDLADHLSRNREAEFLRAARDGGFWAAGVCPSRHPRAGHVRQLGTGYSSNTLRDGPRDGANALRASITYPRADLYTGLPAETLPRLDEIMDNRLRPSSMRTVESAVAWWRKVSEKYGWPLVIPTDHPERGGRMAQFLIYLADDTSLTWASISGYEWGLRAWMQLQHQADPVMGVLGWWEFRTSIKVITIVPTEPRKEIPMEVIEGAVRAANPAVFWEAQCALWILASLFTFARTESSCPKNYTGPEAFNEKFHWQVRDVRGKCVGRRLGVGFRMKGTKPDPRMERPEASGNEDWVYVGDVPDSWCSIVTWFNRVCDMHTRARAPDEPFFVDRDGVRPYRYCDAVADMRTLISRVDLGDGPIDASQYGGHGLRVKGYNASKRAVGEDLTVAHGGWHSSAHKRYDRFNIEADIMDLPSRMVGAMAPLPPGGMRPPLEAQTAPTPRTINRGTVSRGGDGAAQEGGTPTVVVQSRRSAPGSSATQLCSEHSGSDEDEDAELSRRETPPPPQATFQSARLQNAQEGVQLSQELVSYDALDALTRRGGRAAAGAPATSPQGVEIDRA